MSGNRKNGKSESFQKIYSGEIPRINFSDFLIFRFFLNSACGMDSHNKFLNPFRGAPPKLLSGRVLCRLLRLAAVAYSTIALRANGPAVPEYSGVR
jgi:hypothetical protein